MEMNITYQTKDLFIYFLHWYFIYGLIVSVLKLGQMSVSRDTAEIGLRPH